MIEKLFDTVTELPPNGGTFARRNTEATQPPTGVPPKEPPATFAEVTRLYATGNQLYATSSQGDVLKYDVTANSWTNLGKP